MRPIAVLTMATTAVLVAGATTAVASEPAEVRWENRLVEQSFVSEARDMVVSADGTTAYVVGGFRTDAQDPYDAPFLHAVDVATGTTRWTADLDEDLALGSVMVDPSTGQVLASGDQRKDDRSDAVITAFSPAGEQVWTSAVPGSLLGDTAVDATTGRVCAVAASGSGNTWTTRCWSSSGQTEFSRDFRSRSNSYPNAIVIDDVTHQVFVAGGRTRKYRGLVTTMAYTAEGRTLWRRSTRVAETYPDVQDVAIDAKKKRLYVLMDDRRRALVIAQRTTNGKAAFTRSFGSGKSKTPRPKFIDVLPRSHRVVVTSHAKPRYTGTLRYLDKRGRQVALANFRECCDLTYAVVDPATDRISIAWGPGSFDDGVPTEDEGVGATIWDSRGTKLRDLEISPDGQVRVLADIAFAGDDLLVLGDRPYPSPGGQTGSFLVAVR